MRKLKLAAVAAIVAGLSLFGFVQPAGAVCGGGEPGGGCYCPDIRIPKKGPIITC
ncbi:MAG TPA: hypothetical protein VNE62_00790 [Actinomycetota bacterium]|nr:hypothetical protein [Actinomycetota bacterium]